MRSNGKSKDVMRYSFLALFCVLLVFSPACMKRAVQSNGVENSETTMDKSEFVAIAVKGNDSLKAKIARKSTETIIDIGDVLSINIFDKLPARDDKRTEMKRVESDGSIFILPIGAVNVAGLTESEAQRIIQARLGEFIVSPYCEVSVFKKQAEPHVYVFGKIVKTGIIPLKPGATLLDILAEAGGLDQNAYRRQINIVRVEGQKVRIIYINPHDIVRYGKISQNIVMQDGDILFVPWRFVDNAKELLTDLAMVMPWYYYAQTFANTLK
jgi:polysaccharide biosynthesis/export protein